VTTRVVTTHLDTKLARQLDSLAVRLDRPRGWVVMEAVASYLADEEQRHQATLEALAEIDAGEILPQAEIEAWAASLPTPKSAKITSRKR